MSSRKVRIEVEKIILKHRSSLNQFSFGYITSMIYYPKKKRLIVGLCEGRSGLRGIGEKRIEMKVYDPETGECVKEIPCRDTTTCLEIYNDDYFLGGFGNGEVTLFSTQDFEPFQTITNPHNQHIQSLLKLNDSQVVIGNSTSTLMIFDFRITVWGRVADLDHGDYAFSRCLIKLKTQNRFVSGGGKQGEKGWMVMWNYSTFKMMRSFEEEKEIRSITSFVDKSGRELLVSGGVSKNLIFWDLDGSKLKRLRLFQNGTNACYIYFVLNYLNKFLFCCADEGNVFIVNLKSQKQVAKEKFHRISIWAMCIIDEKRNVLVSGDFEVAIKRFKFFYEEDEDEEDRISFIWNQKRIDENQKGMVTIKTHTLFLEIPIFFLE